MKKVGKWILLSLYSITPIASILFFFIGQFVYCFGQYQLNALLYGIAYSCVTQWLLFVFGIFVSKKLKAKTFSKIVQIVTGTLFLLYYLLFSFLATWSNQYFVLYDIIAPFLFASFVPHIVFTAWNHTRKKKLPWILTSITCSVASVIFFVISNTSLLAR